MTIVPAFVHPFGHHFRLAALVAAALPWTGSVVAQEATVSPSTGLRLEAGLTCLREAPLRARVEQWLGQPLELLDTQLQVQGSAHDPRTAVVRVFRDDELLAERQFSPGPPRCEDFTNALAVAGAMMLQLAGRDVEVEAATPQKAPAPPADEPAPRADEPTQPILQPTEEKPAAAPSPPVAASAPRLPPPGTTPRRTPAPLWLHARARALVWPRQGSTGGGAAAQLGVSWSSHFSAQLGFAGIRWSQHAFEDVEGGYTSALLAATLEVCAETAREDAWQVSACLGSWLGRFRIEGRALAPTRSARDRWVSVAGGVRVARRIAGGWRLAGGVELVSRPSPMRVGVTTQAAPGMPQVQASVPHTGAVLWLGAEVVFFAKPRAASGMNVP